ncbi:NADH dehydrogenase [ubiquinone] 1 beta subcomplex subunit 9 [Dendroctonus ponderosae]|uniref:NADH dehydrogenase [ubiquinone] 1 beta subcomplex subunit 9 n=1 Tax=Dendroctonus ponderosae TaxID=77166 RepID=J3JXX6_DENPD|nr:NADH dehydrogenase [ubiquinone] 1 beta subcomplex subunit 9 [Dendroctonus ponderosae]AEE63059.1 unknown [Dendroctonus ponderosae]ERL86856.1 hypothetical protein D910_04259 [Dendroctonus ponderosae]KAH1015050.1 hypothetical protein HUJ05_012834 [Dendroctonus ponderosae]
MAVNLPTGLISHTRRVQSLYKKAIRLLEAYYDERDAFRYRAVLMRKEFDDKKDIKDMITAYHFIELGEQQLIDKQHYHPRRFPDSPGGVAYQREVIPPDWVVDYWHPLEKAQYPEYFARREQRKKEFVKAWISQYGQSTAGHH